MDRFFLKDIVNTKFQLPGATAPGETILLDFLRLIGDIHKKGTEKYAMYGWEAQHDKRDSTFANNLSAIFRHLFKIHCGNTIDSESKFHHAAHIACRWQMATTTLLRSKLSYEEYDLSNTVADLTSPVEYEIPKEVIKEFSKYEFLKFITPETIVTLSNISIKDVYLLLIDWNKQKFSMTDLARRLFINLMNIWVEFIVLPGINKDIGNPKEKLEQWFSFSEELMAFCCYVHATLVTDNSPEMYYV